MWSSAQVNYVAPLAPPLATLPQTLPRDPLLGVLQGVLADLNLPGGKLKAFGVEVCAGLESRNQSYRPLITAQTETELLAARAVPVVVPLLALPAHEVISLEYRGGTVGEATFTIAQQEQWQRLQVCKDTLGRELGYQVVRLDVQWRAQRDANIDVLLTGSSMTLRRMEMEIERASAVTFPVTLEGEFGCPDLEVAAAIHFASNRKENAFSVVDCAYREPSQFIADLDAAMRRSAGGSLFLQSLDLLDLTLQRQVVARLREIRQLSRAQQTPRIIASSVQPFSVLSHEDSFCRLLRMEVDYLRVQIPPLRARRQDLPAQMEQALDKHHPMRQFRLTPTAAELCRSYSWPENECELKRVAARLATMSASEIVQSDTLHRCLFGSSAAHDLQAQTAIREPEEEEAVPVVDEPEPESADLDDEDAEEPEDFNTLVRRRLGDLPRKLSAGEVEGLETLGIGLSRALKFISEHFTEEISLGQLARASFISPSHLSFLFKKTLGSPFKTVLAFVRIERAKQLLMPGGRLSVTEISLEVGFGDLSHFERTFKRLVGTNPREFRRRGVIG